MNSDIDYSTALDRIAANSWMRRELLWLLAKHKGDEETMLDLETVEPGLAEHMRAIVTDYEARAGDDTLDFGRLYDERFAIRAAEVAGATA
jgi:hypothetical protein